MENLLWKELTLIISGRGDALRGKWSEKGKKIEMIMEVKDIRGWGDKGEEECIDEAFIRKKRQS